MKLYLDKRKSRLERRLVETALAQANWNMASAAAILCIKRTRLYALVDRLKLKVPKNKAA